MNCLYITLFFNIVAGIVRTFIKSWNQLLYPRVMEVCRLPFEPRHDFFLYLIDCCLDSGVWWKPHVSSPVTKESRNSSPSCAQRVRYFSAEPIRFVLWSPVNVLGTQRAHNFLYPNFSVTASWIVVLDTSGMMWCNSLIVTLRSGEFLLQFPEEDRQRSKMAYRSFVRRENQSFLRRIHGTTSSLFADS